MITFILSQIFGLLIFSAVNFDKRSKVFNPKSTASRLSFGVRFAALVSIFVIGFSYKTIYFIDKLKFKSLTYENSQGINLHSL